MLRDRESYSPPGTGGVAVPSTILPKASFERHGRGGQSRMTTPSALSKVASQRFLDAQPPLLFQEGNTFPIPEHRDHNFKLRHYPSTFTMTASPSPIPPHSVARP